MILKYFSYVSYKSIYSIHTHNAKHRHLFLCIHKIWKQNYS